MEPTTAPAAVVTGGSKGIGRAIALTLAERGYDVALLDPLVEQGEAVAEEIRRYGRRAMFTEVDVSDERAVQASVAVVEAGLGATPSVLVNNAGIFPRAPALEMPYEDWLRVVRVNLGGAFLCSRAFAPGMFRLGGGSIVNLASGRALAGAVRGSHYAASKGGVVSLTRSLALEWAPIIRVNTIIPGLTDTDQPREDMDDASMAAAGRAIPLGRVGLPDDIARAVSFLVGPDAGFITGQSLCVNGGAILQ